MISADTWFYFKSREIQNEIDSGIADFTELSYCNRAKELVESSLQIQIDMFYHNRELPDNKKKQATKKSVDKFYKDLNNDTTLDANNLLNDADPSILKEVFINTLSPEDNQITHVDFELLIKCILDLYNNSDIFYVDTYSIYRMGMIINHQKEIFSVFEKKHPSISERKKTYRINTKIKDAVLNPKSINANELSFIQKIFAEFIGRFVQTPEEKVLFDTFFSSQTKSPKQILKIIPTRIITNKEVKDMNSIAFKRNKVKNTVLFKLLQSFYPERENYYSYADYPSHYNTAYDKYVDATVNQLFYK